MNYRTTDTVYPSGYALKSVPDPVVDDVLSEYFPDVSGSHRGQSAGEWVQEDTIPAIDYTFRKWSLADTSSAREDWHVVVVERFAKAGSINSRSHRLEKLESELRGFISLAENWDGYGGSAPTASAINNACKMLRILGGFVPVPRVQVGGGGDVGYYWEGENYLIDVTFSGEDEISFFARNKNAEWLGDSKSDGTDIPKDLYDALNAIFNK